VLYLSTNLELHKLRPHLYADVAQIGLYGFCRPGATAQLQDRMNACVDDVALWMQSKPATTELIQKTYQFIIVVNGASHSHKAANIFFSFDSVA